MDTEKEIKKILERNKNVEADKAWEVSFFRMFVILIFTYGAAFVFLWIVKVEDAWIAAFVPVIGYVLSTLSLPSLKKWWLKRFCSKD